MDKRMQMDFSMATGKKVNTTQELFGNDCPSDGKNAFEHRKRLPPKWRATMMHMGSQMRDSWQKIEVKFDIYI